VELMELGIEKLMGPDTAGSNCRAIEIFLLKIIVFAVYFVD
jgi:hypothetical protein